MHPLKALLKSSPCGADIWQVDDMTADLIISQLLLLDAEDPKKTLNCSSILPVALILLVCLTREAINMLESGSSPGVLLICDCLLIS